MPGLSILCYIVNVDYAGSYKYDCEPNAENIYHIFSKYSNISITTKMKQSIFFIRKHLKVVTFN